MADVFTHDLIILGAGLAGLRAAIEASRVAHGKIDIAIISKNQLMRAHSVAAEGGTAAVMRPEDGDSVELHAWDTVKGSDFLADQDVVDLLSTRYRRKFYSSITGEFPGHAVQTVASRSGRLADTAIRAPSWPRTRPASSKCRRFTTHCSSTITSGITTSTSSRRS